MFPILILICEDKDTLENKQMKHNTLPSHQPLPITTPNTPPLLIFLPNNTCTLPNHTP
jgi:hypothetical protein